MASSCTPLENTSVHIAGITSTSSKNSLGSRSNQLTFRYDRDVGWRPATGCRSCNHAARSYPALKPSRDRFTKPQDGFPPELPVLVLNLAIEDKPPRWSSIHPHRPIIQKRSRKSAVFGPVTIPWRVLCLRTRRAESQTAKSLWSWFADVASGLSARKIMRTPPQWSGSPIEHHRDITATINKKIPRPRLMRPFVVDSNKIIPSKLSELARYRLGRNVAPVAYVNGKESFHLLVYCSPGATSSYRVEISALICRPFGLIHRNSSSSSRATLPPTIRASVKDVKEHCCCPFGLVFFVAFSSCVMRGPR